MKRFRPVDRHTAYLLPPLVENWLPEDHLARFRVAVLEQPDLSRLADAYVGRSSVGLNVGAGMTGGLALTRAEGDDFAGRVNNELVDINRINDEKTGEHRAFLREKLERRLRDTGSARARWMLEHFDDAVNRFWLVKSKALTLNSLLKD